MTLLRRRRAPAPPDPPPTVATELADIDSHVEAMFALVPERLAAATEWFVTGDRQAAQELVASDPEIDTLQSDVERLVQVELGRQPLSDPERRFLVTVLRIVPELERCGDLVEHIALRTRLGLTGTLTPRARGLIDEMGRVAVEMWHTVGNAYRDRDASVADALRARDDDLDDLHVELTGELSRASLEPSTAIELGLVARFLERLGDHAVNVARRLVYVAPQPGEHV